MQEAEARDAVSNAGLVLGEIEYVHVDAASVEAGSVASGVASCVVIVLAPHDGDWTYQVWQNAN